MHNSHSLPIPSSSPIHATLPKMASPSTAPKSVAPLHDYFLKDLPRFPRPVNDGKAANVSTSAQIVSSPLCAISTKIKWFEEGRKIFTKIEKNVDSAARRRLYNVGMPASPIVDADDKDLDSNEKRGKRYGPVEHKHEADVVGSSRQFLLDPIERVLWYVCRLDFISGAETTLSGGPADSLLTGRGDVTFTKHPRFSSTRNVV